MLIDKPFPTLAPPLGRRPRPTTLSERIDAAVEAADAMGVGMVIEELEDGLVLTEFVRADDAAPGTGRRALEAILEIADDHDLPVTLSVVAFNNRLIAYYQEIGFEPTEDSEDEDWQAMRREPCA